MAPRVAEGAVLLHEGVPAPVSFLGRLVEYNYLPAHGPFYTGAVWGNVFVVPVVVVLGWLWSRSKFWPLRPIKHGIEGLHTKIDGVHEKLDAHAELHAAHAARLDALHDKVDALLEQTKPT
jgi:hypothetical protein